MSKKKKVVFSFDDAPDLPVAQEPAVPLGLSIGPDEPSGSPKILEYKPLASHETWRVEKFEEFCAEFPDIRWDWADGGVGAALKMMQFHELGHQHSRPWLICRRLFGIQPMIPSADAHPDDLRASSRREICDGLGLELDELQAELDSLRVMWQHEVGKSETETPQVETAPEKPKTELSFGDEVLKEFGFQERMFLVMVHDPATKLDVARSPEETRIERDWFCKRVNEWRKMLSEPVASTLARAALMNDLYLRRFDQDMAVLSPSTRKFEDLYKSKRQLEQQYAEQLAALQEMFPEMAIAGKVNFRSVVSDLIKCHQEYGSNASKQLPDKIFTATEIEVMLRMSVQCPEPKYRFGLNIALVEAMHGLYDPNWRPLFKPSVLKKLDAGFKKAVVELREAQNEPLVDLEKGVLPGEGDDYPDLKEPEL